VYNGSATIGELVERIHHVFREVRFEVILVNDGSRDESERIGSELAEKHPGTVTFLHLSRNFGEHNAVLAGLNHSTGAFVGVLDDDGQNPPEELLRMLAEIKRRHCDVVYGRYRVKRHGWLRNLGSWFANRAANVMLKKPRGLYLSSFKVMNRFTVNEVIKYHGPFPYIDGLIYRCTTNIGQIDVDHCERRHGKSGYTFAKLVRLWMNMFLSFSILPLRLAAWTGFFFAVGSMIALILVWVEKFQLEPNPRPGFRTVLCCVVFFGGLNLLVLGMLGEYLGRLCLEKNGTPQYAVRYVKRCRRARSSASVDQADAEEASPRTDCAATPPYGFAYETIAEGACPISDEQAAEPDQPPAVPAKTGDFTRQGR